MCNLIRGCVFCVLYVVRIEMNKYKINDIARECACLSLFEGPVAEPTEASWDALRDLLKREPTKEEQDYFVECYKASLGIK